MNINMDRRIRIERKVAAPDATYGPGPYTWELVATVWAEVQDGLPSRSESVRSGLAQGRQQTRVRIRHRNDIDSSMRIVAGARVLQIIGGPAEIGGRRAFIELVCEAYTTPGA
jgi:SPP1 family predicted phage head-tail adaptor